MHAAVEEVELDPFDFFIDLGSLILEGRVPGLSEKGYGEGSHCPPAVPGQARHQCSPAIPECQKYEAVLKHMTLLWKNGIPMSVEVLLFPECCKGAIEGSSVDISSAPEISHLLLEQWSIHMIPRRVPDATIAPRGLIQAVRSFLHFSQISAWLSLTGGRSPQNIYYRISVPGEAFSSKFACEPEVHAFPVANIGKGSSVKVSVKNAPRCGNIPTAPCNKHAVPVDVCAISGIAASSRNCTNNSVPKREENFIGAEVKPKLVSKESTSVAGKLSQKPGILQTTPDSMLGESLLDPPQSLQMYPKRYQSPSRCGSPSLEVPEHLMFGTKAKKKDSSSGRMDHRSRPQRRPVVERFLKKAFEGSVPTSASETSLLKSSISIQGVSDLCPESKDEDLVCRLGLTPTSLPREEMEAVLQRLRERSNSRGSKDLCSRTRNTSSEQYHNIPSTVKLKKQQTLGEPHSASYEKDLIPFEDLSLYDSAIVKCTTTPKYFKDSTLSEHRDNQACYVENGSKFSKHVHDAKFSSKLGIKGPVQVSKLGSHQSLEKDFSQKHEASNGVDYLRKIENHERTTNSKLLLDDDEEILDGLLPEAGNQSASNSKRTLNHSKTWSEGLCEQKLKEELLGQSSIFQRRKFRNFITKACNHSVPTSAERAQFRRSLDSATSMVFHQKTGLPLTSSPAPIRKNGRCFDFDSSLTCVSAIKWALFEKPDETECIVESLLSNSAPASTTTSSLIVNFEESVLNGRLEPVSTVQGFVAEIGASGSFCPRHITLPVTVFFYSLQDIDKIVSPYLGHINLGKKGYHVPKVGTIQVTLFNPHQTVVKMFVVRYDLTDMPPNCQTFLRQRTLYMPTDASENDIEASKWLRYLIHLRFASSKSGRIYLHTDIRIIVFRKSDLDAATIHGDRPYELRSFTTCPVNPKFSPCK